ncbi:hypothetical protein TNIN_350921, partial [Trichonephila inaurata madagascariensis]
MEGGSIAKRDHGGPGE